VNVALGTQVIDEGIPLLLRRLSVILCSISSAFSGRPVCGAAYNQLKNMVETEIIFSVQESPEGGYEARALGHPIFTQAESMDELRDMVRDAVRCHFDSTPAPAVIRLHFVKDEVITA